jgi:deoxyribodipyrimidine photolyase-related protein
VVEGVWREGWSHHITRLMVLANIAALLDVSPRALTDWFWVAYTDAWDWVVEPNVLGMGTFAVGEVMTTKPYVAGAAYIHRMGNFCGDCAFDPNGNCPLRRLYWAYLARHESALRANPRVGTVVRSLGRRTPADRARDAALFDTVSSQLTAGRRLTPESLADEL